MPKTARNVEVVMIAVVAVALVIVVALAARRRVEMVLVVVHHRVAMALEVSVRVKVAHHAVTVMTAVAHRVVLVIVIATAHRNASGWRCHVTCRSRFSQKIRPSMLSLRMCARLVMPSACSMPHVLSLQVEIVSWCASAVPMSVPRGCSTCRLTAACS